MIGDDFGAGTLLGTENGGQNQSLMSFLALAEIEQQNRKPLVETRRFSSFLTLLLGVQPEIEGLAGPTLASAAVSNALLAGVAGVEVREIAKNFPKEASQLTLAGQRLRQAYPSHEVNDALADLADALRGAKAQSLAFISSGFASDLRSLAAAWTATAAKVAAAMRTLDRAFGERRISGLGDEASPLLKLLDEVAGGGHSIIGPDGQLLMPRLRDAREFKRVAVNCPAVILRAGERQEAVLRDMSVGGLGLQGIAGLKQADSVRVQVGDDLDLEGKVEWSHEDRAGIKLSLPIEVADQRLRFLTRQHIG